MNPVPWLQMTNMISYQGLVRTFPNVLKYDPDQFRAIIESPEGAGHVGYQYRRNTGATMRMVSDVLDERVSLWDFHCDPSGNVIQPGPNVDSRQYLQAAIDYVSSKEGANKFLI